MEYQVSAHRLRLCRLLLDPPSGMSGQWFQRVIEVSTYSKSRVISIMTVSQGDTTCHRSPQRGYHNNADSPQERCRKGQENLHSNDHHWCLRGPRCCSGNRRRSHWGHRQSISAIPCQMGRQKYVRGSAELEIWSQIFRLPGPPLAELSAIEKHLRHNG